MPLDDGRFVQCRKHVEYTFGRCIGYEGVLYQVPSVLETAFSAIAIPLENVFFLLASL